ncbi:MAG: HAD-IA family hydrolase [Chloroflexi bacterium]|nr:HAD-IA family hydrolase [Chloroflexota bacterium]
MTATENGFDFVFFDVGETLVYPHPSFHEIVAAGCAEIGHPVAMARVAEAERVALRRTADLLGPGLWSTPERSRRFWQTLYQSFVHEFGLPPDCGLPKRLYDRFTRLETYRLFDDSSPALAALRARGIRLGVISNWETWLEQLLVALGIRPFFDVVVISGACGIEKPDRGIFDCALAEAGVEPGRAAHVGDSPRHDVAGARNAGMTPILVDRRGRYADADGLRVADLRELEQVLFR